MEMLKCLCGGEAYSDPDGEGDHIRCIDCGATVTRSTEAEAVAAWNRRALRMVDVTKITDPWAALDEAMKWQEEIIRLHAKLAICAVKNCQNYRADDASNEMWDLCHGKRPIMPDKDTRKRRKRRWITIKRGNTIHHIRV